MKMVVSQALCAVALVTATLAGAATRRGDQAEAFDARRQGRILPLKDIERRVIPTMKGAQYIGFDFESSTGIYTLKFLRDGTVIWVEVDGRSGQIVGRTDK